MIFRFSIFHRRGTCLAFQFQGNMPCNPIPTFLTAYRLISGFSVHILPSLWARVSWIRSIEWVKFRSYTEVTKQGVASAVCTWLGRGLFLTVLHNKKLLLCQPHTTWVAKNLNLNGPNLNIRLFQTSGQLLQFKGNRKQTAAVRIQYIAQT